MQTNNVSHSIILGIDIDGLGMNTGQYLDLYIYNNIHIYIYIHTFIEVASLTYNFCAV